MLVVMAHTLVSLQRHFTLARNTNIGVCPLCTSWFASQTFDVINADGNFHVLCPFDASNEDMVRELHEVEERMVYRAIEMGGSCTGT